MHRYLGVALGGPRHGIRLDAGEHWDGRIKLPHAWEFSTKDTAYYPGYYAWSSYRKAWVWHEGRRPQIPL